MARKTIIAGNWKMNKIGAEAEQLAAELITKVAHLTDAEIVVCPTFTSLGYVAAAVGETNIKLGAQNIHWAESGAYTGEISAEMLREIGVEYVIIGHSERRQYFGETDETVNLRTKAALAADLIPIVCIGETLEEREGDKTEEVLLTQLQGGLKDLSPEQVAGLVIAYEPVWAIGTGKTATPEMAEEAHKFIRCKLAEMFNTEAAEAVRIQYGGSMKAENSAELVGQEDIDGGLIGGASLNADSFAELIKNAIS